MKIWFNKEKIDFTKFKSEQFLLGPFYDLNVIALDKNFKNALYSWIKSIGTIVTATSLEEADVYIYHDKLNTDIGEYIELAKQHNKNIIAFYNDDNSTPIALPTNVKVYRTSILKSKQKENEYPLPAWSEDFYTSRGNINIRSKGNKAVIGFCGAITHPIRNTAINLLKHNINIETNFLLRNSFWGGNIHNQDLRNEYINNILDSDFILCCRGAGNFSYRLYETMSLGRVPIIVDTDIALPCDDIIDWKTISIWVNDINCINEHINEFWNNITDVDYKKLQYKIRSTYEDYICPSGFALYLSNKYTNERKSIL